MGWEQKASDTITKKAVLVVLVTATITPQQRLHTTHHHHPNASVKIHTSNGGSRYPVYAFEYVSG